MSCWGKQDGAFHDSFVAWQSVAAAPLGLLARPASDEAKQTNKEIYCQIVAEMFSHCICLLLDLT